MAFPIKGTSLESYLDESARRAGWDQPQISAHVTKQNDIGWYFTLHHEATRQGYTKEIKSSKAENILRRFFNRESQRRFWDRISEIPLIVIDPRKYLELIGLYQIDRDHYEFVRALPGIPIHKDDPKLQSLGHHILKLMLCDSPLLAIEHAVVRSEIILTYPEFEINIDPIIERMGKGVAQQEINIPKLAGRLESAFIEMKDPESLERILDHLYHLDPTLILPEDYYRESLLACISPTRYFDEGHSMSAKYVRDLYMDVYQRIEDPFHCRAFPRTTPQIIEIDSIDSAYMRVSDIVEGIARRIYEREGLDGLRKRFRLVILNGKAYY